MKFDFTTIGKIDEIEDIKRNINNIMSIPAGSIPLSRGLGVSWSNLDNISEDLENDIITELAEKIAEYEPRVSLSEVTFDYDTNGKATLNIVLEGGEENE